MTLSREEVRHVAMLARLALDDEQVDHLAPQLAEILAYAEKVGQVAAEDVPPTSHPVPLANVWRDDTPRPSLPREDILRPGPDVEDGRFAVPRIVAEEA